jgi:hypothetical protein
VQTSDVVLTIDGMPTIEARRGWSEGSTPRALGAAMEWVLEPGSRLHTIRPVWQSQPSAGSAKSSGPWSTGTTASPLWDTLAAVTGRAYTAIEKLEAHGFALRAYDEAVSGFVGRWGAVAAGIPPRLEDLFIDRLYWLDRAVAYLEAVVRLLISQPDPPPEDCALIPEDPPSCDRPSAVGSVARSARSGGSAGQAHAVRWRRAALAEQVRPYHSCDGRREDDRRYPEPPGGNRTRQVGVAPARPQPRPMGGPLHWDTSSSWDEQ